MNNSMNKIGKFLREVLVIVIGIAITLSASHWISNRNEKRDMALYLNAVKLELEENIKILHEEKKYLQKEVEYANYLKTNDKNSVNFDTILINYGNNIWSVRKPNCNSYAFEMFKLSGTMRFIGDKELLLTLWKAYNSLYLISNILFEEGFQSKTEEIKREMSLLSQTIQGKELTTIPMCNYYSSTIWSDNMLHNCTLILDFLEKAILRLEY
ncbi:MAG: hypothetical protein FWH23_03145 [Bacteroidales bacterium]|nr:hypothetical protein [Bacteroidales bacterium]